MPTQEQQRMYENFLNGAIGQGEEAARVLFDVIGEGRIRSDLDGHVFRFPAGRAMAAEWLHDRDAGAQALLDVARAKREDRELALREKEVALLERSAKAAEDSAAAARVSARWAIGAAFISVLAIGISLLR